MNTKKHILSSLRFSLLIAVPLLFFVTNLNAAGGPPAGYYSSIEGKKDSVLKSTLGALTFANYTTRLSFGSGSGKTWQGLYYTDRNTTDNSVIDMYSTVKRYFNPEAPTASVTNCDIEHMFANSWFGGETGKGIDNGNQHAYCDLHHLVPSDYSANRSKSNRGPGIPTDTTFNNGVWVNGKDANRDNLSVFCPPDEYKGDFARAFFYIATTYGDTAIWQSEAVPNFMTNDSWQEFLPYLRDLLLSWHRMDPVSDKERVRMNEVYKIQGNRNPFIDYPCLAEYIWGDKSGQTVSLALLTSAYDDGFADEGCTIVTTPLLTSPAASIHVGATSAGVAISKAIHIKGINLTEGNLTLALSGANAGLFSLSTTSVSKTNAEVGYDVTVTYTPTANGSHGATLTISGCGITTKTFDVSGSCANTYTATWMSKGGPIAQTTAAEGQTPAIPDAPDDCSATRVFMGWTEQSSVSSRPADLFTEDAPALTSNKTFYAVFADEEVGSGSGGSDTYTFSSKSWAASPSDWTSGQDATQYTSGKGVTVRTATSGANATCKTSYENVQSITVNYCTNASSGAGSVTITVGETSDTQAVTSSGGATLRDLTFDFSGAHPTGAPIIMVECTTNSVYINSITIIYGPPTSYSYYSLACSTAPAVSVTATFMDGASTYDTKTGNAGQAVSVTDPTPCDGYIFSGWSLNTYAASNTSAPTIDFTGTLPSSDATYHAVYSHTEAGGGTGAPVGTTLWSEDFGSYAQYDHTEGMVTNATGRTIYNGGSVTYAYSNGSTNTRIYGEGNTWANGVPPELMIGYNNGYFSISGIPTAGADTMTLTFKTNKAGNAYFTISSGTAGVSVLATSFEGVTDGVGVGTCNIKNVGELDNFDLSITNPHGNTNNRVDDFSLIIKSTKNASTTYYTTSPACCTHTITAISPDDTKGTATVALP